MNSNWRRWCILWAVLLTAVLGGWWWWTGQGARTGEAALPAPAATYVGAQACAACHPQQTAAWQGSQHAQSMQAASRAAVLAPFAGEQLRHGRVTSTFTQRQGRFYVRTDGADGTLQEFEVTHTLGLAPLQQYLVPLPGGRMQALATAWDSRPAGQGGQRWFHLQGDQGVRTGDALHWTGRQANWNYMCAECHSTQFEKHYDAASATYQSHWAEMNVACEACHGPASAHLAWAHRPSTAGAAAGKGFALALNGRAGVHWPIAADTGNAQRSAAPPADRQEVELCARCHAHRTQLSDQYQAGQPLQSTHRPTLIAPGLFWSDGQMRAEVYNYASFLQSKMYQKGVSCSDCHDPHSGGLRAPDSQVCLQCHAGTRYATPSHHFHPAQSAGAQCANCHMPTTTYMRVDPRHDHSLRVPRPDLSLARGTPNACNQCHRQQSVAWAARWATAWYPGLAKRPTPLADALYASETGAPNARTLLLQAANSPPLGPMARASALARLDGPWNPAEQAAVRAALADGSGLVRAAAIDLLATAPLALREPLLRPLLADPLAAVRMAAGRALADAAVQGWDAAQRARWQAAVQDYVHAQQFNADRPESWNNLGLLYAAQGEGAQAEQALQQALAMAPEWMGTYLNLADVYRQSGREAQALAVLQQAQQRAPGNAAVVHALGLALHRQQRPQEALQWLQQAARLAPDDARMAYVAALALDARGQHLAAIVALETTLQHHASDRAVLEALVAFSGKLPDAARVRTYRQRLAQLQ